MKQIYFTFCRENYSVSGKGGDSARAASEGIFGSELNEFKKYASWSEPEGLLQIEPDKRCAIAPRALKFQFMPGRGWMIIHAVYASPDKQTKREGNYFAHVLTDLPKEWGAREALELWNSAFWVSQDSLEINPKLPDVEPNAVPKGNINEESFVRFLQENEQHVQLFRELLENWLVRTEKKEQFVLLAKPEVAAFCIWGLTRVLPRPYWNKISFSTYEKPTTLLNYDITAFSPLEETFQSSDQVACERLAQQWPAIRVFPRGCSSFLYQDNKALLQKNDHPVSPEVELVDEWISLVKQGDYASIDVFFQKAPEAYYSDMAKLRLLWRFWHEGKRLTMSDVQAALQLPELRENAENIVKGFTKLETAFHFFDLLTQAGKDALLERLWKEKTLNEVRQEPLFRTSLVRDLSGYGTPQSGLSSGPSQYVPQHGVSRGTPSRASVPPRTQQEIQPESKRSGGGCFFFFLMVLATATVFWHWYLG